MQRVEIRLKGHIDRQWTDWIWQMSVSRAQKGETVLVGLVRDQAALRGFIDRLTDLGIELISVVTMPLVEGQNTVREKEGTGTN
jgi:hypothetical protein